MVLSLIITMLNIFPIGHSVRSVIILTALQQWRWIHVCITMCDNLSEMYTHINFLHSSSIFYTTFPLKVYYSFSPSPDWCSIENISWFEFRGTRIVSTVFHMILSVDTYLHQEFSHSAIIPSTIRTMVRNVSCTIQYFM